MIRSRAVLIAVWLLSLAVYAAYFQGQWVYGERPIYHITGDEPHYLVVATSLLRDGDLDVYNNYRDRHFLPFYPYHLGDARDPEDMHALYGRGGALYSKHGLGLSLLLLPALAGGGAGWATVLMLAVSALLAVQILQLALQCAWQCGRKRWPAVVAWVAVAFSPPLLLYAHQFYPEVPGALLTVVGLRALAGVAARRATWPAFVAGASIALLPWFHLRYVPIAVVLGLIALTTVWPAHRRLAIATAVLTPPVLSGLALLALNWHLFGGVPSVSDYGTLSPIHLLTGAPGVLLDRQFGLLPYAPVHVFALAGLPLVLRVLGWRPGGALLLLVFTYAGFVASFSFWYGAFSPPARMLVPIVPLLVVPMALALATWDRWPVRLAVGGTLVLTWAMARLLMEVPRLRYSLPDGKSEMLEYLSLTWGTDVTWVWPSFIQPSAASYVWLAAAVVTGLTVCWRVANGEWRVASGWSPPRHRGSPRANTPLPAPGRG
jgi:hypothetical protein